MKIHFELGDPESERSRFRLKAGEFELFLDFPVLLSGRVHGNPETERERRARERREALVDPIVPIEQQ